MINRRTFTTIALSGVIALGTAGAAQARHGADDPPGHNAGDDHGQHHGGRGADDPKARHARHHRRHGGDDGPGHS
jgi:hypothetical protein